jgi:hypothetical protein
MEPAVIAKGLRACGHTLLCCRVPGGLVAIASQEKHRI